LVYQIVAAIELMNYVRSKGVVCPEVVQAKSGKLLTEHYLPAGRQALYSLASYFVH